MPSSLRARLREKKSFPTNDFPLSTFFTSQLSLVVNDEDVSGYHMNLQQPK
jgi:hypothetical protein